MADAEERLVIPPLWACGAVFDLSGGIWGLLWAFLRVLGRFWGLLGRSWGGLGRSWGDLAVTFRAFQFSIDFLSDFGRPRGAKREAFWEQKWSKIGPKTHQKSVRFLT